MSDKILILIIFFWFGGASGNRVRRHLVFNEGSRVFFSVDLRDNLFDYSDFFAQVFGFKLDWDLPSKIDLSSTSKRLERRDLYQGIEQLLYRKNINGTSCIRKFLCEASVILPKNNHFLAQFYEVIFLDGNTTKDYGSENFDENCGEVANKMESDCPLSLTSLFSK